MEMLAQEELRMLEIKPPTEAEKRPRIAYPAPEDQPCKVCKRNRRPKRGKRVARCLHPKKYKYCCYCGHDPEVVGADQDRAHLTVLLSTRPAGGPSQN